MTETERSAKSSSGQPEVRPAGSDDTTHQMPRELVTGELPELPPSVDDGVKPRIRPVRITIKIVAFIAVVYFFVLPLLPDFRNAVDQLIEVQPGLLILGLGLQIAALFSYSLLTRAALGGAGDGLSAARMFRIQLSTKALTNIVPGGNAAGSALGYRLLTLSGVSGPDAGFALATAGIASAVVLNVIFWIGLIVSIPIRGVNPGYGTAALAGIIIIGIAATLVFGLMEGQGRSERAVRWFARQLRFDDDKFAAVLHQIGDRLEELARERQLMRRVVFWAALNWLLDAASLWVFIRAFGYSLDIDALIVTFGLANLVAAIPITPGGIGYVDLLYVSTLVGFGVPSQVARLAVPSYRLAQFFLPIVLGAVAYASLRVGPWSIEKRDRLSRLRELARLGTERGESKIDWTLRLNQRRSSRSAQPTAVEPATQRDGASESDSASAGGTDGESAIPRDGASESDSAAAGGADGESASVGDDSPERESAVAGGADGEPAIPRDGASASAGAADGEPASVGDDSPERESAPPAGAAGGLISVGEEPIDVGAAEGDDPRARDDQAST